MAERWYETVIAYLQRRERTAALRKRLADARAAGKAIRHQQRLREQAKGKGQRWV